MKSGANFRDADGGQIVDTHLVLHHCIADILNHTAEFVRILNIIKETLDFPLPLQSSQTLANIFQIPSNSDR